MTLFRFRIYVFPEDRPLIAQVSQSLFNSDKLYDIENTNNEEVLTLTFYTSIEISGYALDLQKRLETSIARLSQYGACVTQRGTNGNKLYNVPDISQDHIETILTDLDRTHL